MDILTYYLFPPALMAVEFSRGGLSCGALLPCTENFPYHSEMALRGILKGNLS